jgi:hypothetical protein
VPDLTRGYFGGGKGNCAIVEAIFSKTSFNAGLPEPFFSKALFQNNFMPYAKSNWAYEASYCNCEDLATAFLAVWDYVTAVKRDKSAGAILRPAKYKTCALVTNVLRYFAGPACGNVRRRSDGQLDGRSLFPLHYMVQSGSHYLDPTFDLVITGNPAATEMQAEVKRLGTAMKFWITLDGRRLYAFSSNTAPNFGDSWVELDAAGYLTVDDWKAKTARSGHTRSGDLSAVDNALKGFETTGWDGFDKLKTAFATWVQRNANEVSHRNVGNCITGLAGFLGVPMPVR